MGSVKPTLLASDVSSYSSYNYLCTSLDNYKDLTIDNFFVVLKSMLHANQSTTNTGALTKSYDPATGNLTISAYYIGNGLKNSGGSNIRVFTIYDLYLVR